MAIDSGISWTQHTINFWLGCQEASPGCNNCYARTLINGRMGGNFDVRRRTAPATFNAPLKMQKPSIWFCMSLGDFFDNKVDPQWREDAWSVMDKADQHRYLVLTKRPPRIKYDRPEGHTKETWPHVWFGTSTEDNEYLTLRAPHIMQEFNPLPWISAEPLIGPLTNLRDFVDPSRNENPVKWVILGGESGNLDKIRETKLDWIREAVETCREFGAVPFVKQTGSILAKKMRISGKGDNPAEWPEWMQIQEVPQLPIGRV